MNREFNDELLSAYLDGQLAAGDVAAVEAHLAANPDARVLLAELRQLSAEIRDLPRLAAGSGFADQVVMAALAAKAERTMVSPAAKSSNHDTPNKVVLGDQVRRGSRLPVVLAGVAAIAAAVALAVWVNSEPGESLVPGDNHVSAETEPETVPDGGNPAEAALAHLRQAIPQEGEVVVVRIRIAPGSPVGKTIDAALASAGIEYRSAADESTAAMPAAAAYQQQLLAKFGGQEPGVPNVALRDGTIPATDAVFVEASWETLEKAVGALAATPERKLEISPLSKVVASAPSPTGTNQSPSVEGEGGKRGKNAPAPETNFAQRLPASVLRLEKEATEPAVAPPPAAPIEGQRKVRVLLLVEQQ